MQNEIRPQISYHGDSHVFPTIIKIRMEETRAQIPSHHEKEVLKQDRNRTGARIPYHRDTQIFLNRRQGENWKIKTQIPSHHEKEVLK